MRMMMMAVLLSGAASAAEVPANSPLKPICDLVCGTWDPEAIDDEHNMDSFRIELHWEDASGELRGTQTSFGGLNGTNVHEIAFKADTGGNVTLVTRAGDYAVESRVDVKEMQIRVFSVTPGNPTVTSIVMWSVVEADRMSVTRAESASQYNNWLGEQFYTKAK